MNTPSRETIIQTIEEHIKAAEELSSTQKIHRAEISIVNMYYANALIILLETFDNGGQYPDADLFHMRRLTLNERLELIKEKSHESHSS